MERGLFIGRFQPFHRGHLSVLQQMDKDSNFGEILIGIGSSQYRNYLDNPFSSRERRIMIERSLELEKPHRIFDIPDIHNWPLWVGYLEKRLPKFRCVYSGNNPVRSLLEEKGYEVKEATKIESISGTKIRHYMIEGKDWSSMVTEQTYDAIKSFGGEKRLLNIYRRFIRPVVTADMILDYQGKGLALIKRGIPPFKGLPALAGGHLEVGCETTKETAIREALEETGIVLDPENVHLLDVYSDPGRDPRGSNVCVVYWTKVESGSFRAGDDAKGIRIYPYNKIPNILAFDHRRMVDDYLERVVNKRTG